jgi:hypothetical protein
MAPMSDSPAATPAAGHRAGARILTARGRSRSWPGTAAGIGAPLLLIGVLAWPLLFTDATFNEDWVNHLWYMWHQSLAIRANHAPSLFLDYSEGVLYPFYAFYGGTLYALTGMLSLALGDAPLAAYTLTYLLGFAAAYGGWLWLARMFGLRGWTAHVPGLVFVTSAAYLTMVYGLGDWPEFLAVSAMAPLIASGLSVLRAPRLRFWPATALAASSVLYFGSHLLTVIWGSTCMALLGGAFVICIPEARRQVTRAGVLRVAGLVIPALLLSAWFLLPAAAYETQTVTAHSYPFHDLLQRSMYTVAARHLFTLSRERASGSIVTLALPVLAIAWALASTAILLWTRRAGAWMRALLLTAGLTVLLLVLMTHAGLIVALPRIYAIVEFSFRLESYVLMGVSGMLLMLLVLTRDGGRSMRWWRGLLAPIAAVSLLGAIEQVGGYTQGMSRGKALSSFRVPIYEREGLLDYVDDELPVIHARLPLLSFPRASEHDDRAVAVTRLPAGLRVDTNLRAGPDLIDLGGARIVGTDAHADDVLEIARERGTTASAPAPGGAGHPAPARATRITVTAGDRLPVLAGRWLSLLALVALIAQFGLLALRGIRGGGRRAEAAQRS